MYRFTLLLAVALAAIILTACGSSTSTVRDASAYDEWGYNDVARIFNGIADGVDEQFGNGDMGNYANDHLVMKWNRAWDAGNDCDWDPQQQASFENAWTDNEWNGQVPGGSGETWHYKIKWIGLDAAGHAWPENHEFADGGYAIWGQFEVVLSQGTVDNGHIWDTLANPAGYGAPSN